MDVESVEKQALEEISGANSLQDIEKVRIDFLGRKGKLTSLLRSISSLPHEERKEFGKRCNELRNKLEKEIEKKLDLLKRRQKKEKLKSEFIDVTLPCPDARVGALHPISKIMDDILRVFVSMGFSVVEGPEVETDFHNFEALNMPKGHPAREMQDTFYISDDIVLRTHTSPVQIRVMLEQSPPIQVVAPGKVYRKDADVTHTPMFHQIEGLMVDRRVTFSDMKGILEIFLREIFGEKTDIRFRPSYFPFTEPSAEVDIGCVICGGEGCKVCKGTGWLEILGCGMVDPIVFKHVGIDSDIYQGFAFGMGVERIAMLKYGIDDLRLFFDNDVRFLKQFRRSV